MGKWFARKQTGSSRCQLSFKYFTLQLQTCHMPKYFLFFCCCLLMWQLHASPPLTVSCPNKSITVSVYIGKTLSYTIAQNGQVILQPSGIDMLLNDGRGLSKGLKLQSATRQTVYQQITSPTAEKSVHIEDNYNQLTIQFTNSFGVIFRLYNDGVAYRLFTRFKDSVYIKHEQADFAFVKGSGIIAPVVQKRPQQDIYHTSFEELYRQTSMDSIAANSLLYSPVVIDEHSLKIALTESDLLDYPGMFLKLNGQFSLEADFAAYPLQEQMTDELYAEKIVTQRADFIAHTRGNRVFPWRVLIIARHDKDLPASNMVYRLATASAIADPSWIKPGKCTDEWIIDINLFNVPFKTGINTTSYKYYIDFAQRFGFSNIMMDAGWSDPGNLFTIRPEINMDSITAYARAKGIKLSLWTLAATLDRQLDSALDRFNQWGIDFIMTDFIDRDDQKAVQLFERITAACAAHKIMIMFHGSFAPKGFNRTWPNNITREAVLGSEYNAWSDKPTPEHDLILPFTRMLAGPMDYEPGLLDNATAAQFKPIWGKVMSQGTRCHQLAMFAVYDNPMQIFAGNPSQGYQEPAFMELLGSIHSSWDTTVVVDAKLGDYIVTARKKNSEWFIGSMTDWTARTLNLVLDFIEDGEYDATICADGINAHRYPADYTFSKRMLRKGDHISIPMAPGGGCLMRLRKK
jgi:alpha-glucosidase